MSNDGNNGIEDYFHNLVDLPAEEQRRKLNELPLSDEQREELAALLNADSSQDDAFLYVSEDSPANHSTARQLNTNPAASTDSASQFPLAVGDMLGEYRLLRLLGEGAFGSVWEAYDTKLSRGVAIKIPKRVNTSERDRMLREAQAVAQLSHPYLLTVHRVVDEPQPGRVFIVTDLATGGSLKDQMGQARSPREVVKLAAKLARGLACAHKAGIVHRDLKPDNVLLDGDGEPLIADFGLAKRLTTDVTRTIEGMVMGTPAYMSPELAQGHGYKADVRSDVFSMGVILYELLTGERPFRGSVRMVMEQIIKDEPTDPRRLNAAIPKDVATICLKCLRKPPVQRYADAAALAEDLERWLAGKPVAARPVGPIGKFSRWCRRHPAVALTSTLFVLSLIAGISVSLALAWRADRRARQITRQDAAQRLAGHALEFREWKPRLGLTLALEAVELSRSKGESVPSQVAWTLSQLCSEMHPTTQLVADADQICLMDHGVLFTRNKELLWKAYTGQQVRLASDPVERLVANASNCAVGLHGNTGRRWTQRESDGKWVAGTAFEIAAPYEGTNPHHRFGLSPDGQKFVVHRHIAHGTDYLSSGRGELIEFQFAANGDLANRQVTETQQPDSLEVFDIGIAYGTPQAAWWRGFADRNAQTLPLIDRSLDLSPQFALSPDMKHLAMAQFDKVSLLRVEEGVIGVSQVLEGAPHVRGRSLYKNRIAFTSETSLLVTGEDGLIEKIWFYDGRRETFDFQSPVWSVASWGDAVAFGTSAGVAWIDEPSHPARPNRCLDGTAESIRFVDLGNETHLAIAGGREVRLWDYKLRAASAPLQSPAGGLATKISHDGAWFIVESEASLVHRADGANVQLSEPAARHRVSSFSPDSRFLATALRSTTSEPSRVEIRALSDTGPRLVFAADTSVPAARLQWSTTGVLTGLDPKGEVYQCARSPDGWKMVAGSIDKFDPKNVKFDRKDVQFSADHRRIVVASQDGLALVECGDTIESNWLQRGAAQRGAIAPSGQSVACVLDGEIIVWETRERLEVFERKPIAKSELSDYATLQFSPDGKMLAFGNGNSLLLGRQGRQWKWREFVLQRQFVYLLFTPDGQTLFATSFAGPSSENPRSELIRINLARDLDQSEPVRQPFEGLFMEVHASSPRMVTWGVLTMKLDPPLMAWDLTSPSQIQGVPLLHTSTYRRPEFLDSGEVFTAGGYVLDPSLDGWVRRARAIVDRPLTAAQRQQFRIPK